MRKRNFTGVRPGFHRRGQADVGFGKFPVLELGGTTFAPSAILAADLLQYKAASLPSDAIEQRDALNVHATLLIEVGIGRFDAEQAKQVYVPMAQSLKAVATQIEQIPGMPLAHATAQWFADLFGAEILRFDTVDIFGEFKPEAFRTTESQRYNEAAEVFIREADRSQNFAFVQDIEGTAIWFLGASAHLLKLCANYPSLEIPGIEKLVTIAEQFRAAEASHQFRPDPIASGSIAFCETLPPKNRTIGMKVSETISQSITYRGEPGLEKLHGFTVGLVSDLVGASPMPHTLVLIEEVADSFVREPLPGHTGPNTRTAPASAGRAATARTTELTTAGSSEHGSSN